MSPADVPALAIFYALSCAAIFYAGYRIGGWIADRIIEAVQYLTRFEKH